MIARNWRYFDFPLLGATLLLILIGVAFVYSATLGVDSLADSARRQLIFAGIGLVVMLVVAALDYRMWSALHLYIYGVTLALLALLFVIGQVRGGAQGWFDVGSTFSIQPAELAKVLLIVTLAALLAQHKDDIQRLLPVLGTLVYMMAPTLLIFLQPDLGTAVVMVVVWLVMVWVAGLRPLHMGYLGVTGLLALPAVWLNMADYQRERVMPLIDPSLTKPDIQYMRDQALISIGSSSWLGKGFASGTQTQLHFLRVRHTDFIFSVIVEEVGWVGAMIVLALIAIVLWRILRIASLSRDDFGRYLCVGVAMVIFFQTVVSVGMNLGLLPITGLTLPFISYGGSSLLTLLLSLGFVQSVAMRQKLIEF
jgi:rod shape determining protein RodA